MAQTSDVKYEDALARLEKLVDELDRSDVDLETRFKKFEEGVKLLASLTKRLEQVKKKVDVLIKSQRGEPSTAPFADATDPDHEDDASP